MRTILYYPNFIPPESWIRQTILYSDQIASIVPSDIERYRPSQVSNATLDLLRGEGEYRAIRPENFLSVPEHKQKTYDLYKEFASIANSEQFQSLLPESRRRKFDWPMASAKFGLKGDLVLYMTSEFDYIAKQDPKDPNWYLFEEHFALLYLSLLAKYLTDIDPYMTTPGTDCLNFEKLSYGAIGSERYSVLDIKFKDILPVPRQDVPLDDLLRFKRKRRMELLHFREVLDGWYKDFAAIESQDDLKALLVLAKESIEKEMLELTWLFRDAKIKAALGSLKTLIDLNSPAIWASFVAVANPTVIQEIPIELKLIGIGLAGAIQVSNFVLDVFNVARAQARQSPFAFLFQAQKENIID